MHSSEGGRSPAREQRDHLSTSHLVPSLVLIVLQLASRLNGSKFSFRIRCISGRIRHFDPCRHRTRKINSHNFVRLTHARIIFISACTSRIMASPNFGWKNAVPASAVRAGRRRRARPTLAANFTGGCTDLDPAAGVGHAAINTGQPSSSLSGEAVGKATPAVA